MSCPFCAKGRPVRWWAKPTIGPESEMCDPCLRRVGKRDEAGKYIAVPIEQHRENSAECGVSNVE